MIKSIKMKNCATYSAKGVLIDNCQKINFFYGPNGSGKSTISNYLYDQSNPLYESCEIEWVNNIPTDIVVYNREFRNRHFKEDIDGIFTLGKATIEEKEELEKLKKERDKKIESLTTRKTSLKDKTEEESKCKSDFKKIIWNVILKENENDFKEAFGGLRGNKEKFYAEVVNRYKKSHLSNEKKESLQKRSKILFSNTLEKYNNIDIDIDGLMTKLEIIEKDPIWRKIVVGNKDVPIAGLINHLDNSDWVNKGREYVSENGVCPFCQQKTITKELQKELETFFSGEYERDIQHIRDLIESYKFESSRLLLELENVTKISYVSSIGNMDVSTYTTKYESLKLLFTSILTEMSSKEKETNKKVTLSESKNITSDLLKMISVANDNIATNNKLVDNCNIEKKLLIDDIWTFLMDEQEALIGGHLKKLSELVKAKDGINRGILEYEKQIQDLDKKIYEAGKNITSVQPAVDEINRSLKAYGFTNFKIVPSASKENSYQIQRMDGSLATNTLSEGEETFISFLYFLQFAKGSIDADKISSKKILVLDDPICSLDSTVLYIVSSMVKTLIKDIRDKKSDVEQIFILTHNVFFHKEASFIDGRTKVVNDIYYWIISKDNNITSLRVFESDNPIKTSYELLWEELKTNTTASLITTQNIMRRIIENYFSMLGKEVDETIVSSFPSIEEQIICRSLISWINDGSHSIPDDLYIDSYTDSIDRYKEVFKEIFKKMGHKAHYNMMMGIKENDN